MTYTAEELEKQFQQIAGIRRGKKKFERDDGYWDGGRCNWGGSHNLKEDCEMLSRAFNKMESFGKIREELQNCTSKNEYDAKKANYIRKCDEIIDGLAIKNKGANNEGANFIFGICCIWGKNNKDNEKNIESKAKVAQRNLQQLKKSLEKEDYRWVQEIKELNLEVNEIKQRIEENKLKATKESDPVKKAILIQAIEDDGKLLQEKYTKRKELGSKLIFDPSKHVSNLINSIKKSIERSGNITNKSPRTPNIPDTDSEDNNTDDESLASNKNTPQNFFQNNQSLIILGIIATLLILYFYYSSEEEPNYYDF